MKQSKKLVLIGSTKNSVHIRNYYNLIKDYFDEILIIGNTEIDYCKSKSFDFSIRNFLSLRNRTKKLRTIIDAFNPDIVHVHQANSYAFITAKANNGKYPLILTTWGSDVLVLPKISIIHRYIVKYGLKKANIITADANFMADTIKHLGINKSVDIANFGIEYNQVTIPEKENIIYSNRLHNELYNIPDIINAFSKFIEENKEWQLIIGANGDLTDSLKAQAKNILPENSYQFIGFVDKEENKRQYLRAKIWASVPSSDGTAISLLEAMGYGCIPVVSDLPANKEWITNNKNGIINENNLVDAFKKATLLNLQQVQTINQKIITEKATKKANRAIFETLYDKLIKTTKKQFN